MRRGSLKFEVSRVGVGACSGGASVLPTSRCEVPSRKISVSSPGAQSGSTESRPTFVPTSVPTSAPFWPLGTGHWKLPRPRLLTSSATNRVAAEVTRLSDESSLMISSATVLLLLITLGLLTPSPAAAASWESRPWGRERALEPDRAAGLRLQRIPGSSSGIAFTNALPVERFTTNQIYLNGSGVALGDVDGDGLCDVFLAGLSGRSTLYRNRGGWKFEDVTVASGSPAAALDATGALLADIDGDGDLDLTVSSVGGGTLIHVNDGKGRFSRSALLNPDRCGTSLAFADFDGDGSLDLYVANYRTVTLRDQPATQFKILPVDGRLHVASVNGRPNKIS